MVCVLHSEDAEGSVRGVAFALPSASSTGAPRWPRLHRRDESGRQAIAGGPMVIAGRSLRRLNCCRPSNRAVRLHASDSGDLFSKAGRRYPDYGL